MKIIQNLWIIPIVLHIAPDLAANQPAIHHLTKRPLEFENGFKFCPRHFPGITNRSLKPLLAISFQL
jgi:hypothetical protein